MREDRAAERQGAAVNAIDSVRDIETPEGVDMALSVAGPVVRALAWSLDQLIRGAGYLAVGSVLGLLGEAGMGLLLIVIFGLEWFYPVWFEVRWRGQTPGKRAMGLAVVHDDGTPVGWAASILRNLLRFADFLPFAYLFGFASMVASPGFQRLGDLAASTLVVYRERRGKPPVIAEGAALPLPEPLTLQEQRAVIAFAERAPAWTVERQGELAGLAEGLVGAAQGQDAVARLTGMARWLVGRR